MRWSTAALLVPGLTGCSFIYNPGNLPDPTPIDAAEPDANPSMLTLLDIVPNIIDEGQGDFGSPPALLVLRGKNMVNANLKVELVPPPGVIVHLEPITDARASHDANFIAFTVTARVDTMLSADVSLDVRVTQDVADQYGGGMATATGMVTLHGLPELTSASPGVNKATKIVTMPLQAKYSMVDLADVTPVTIAGTARGAISAVSSIKLGDVVANAQGATAGPGGFSAGAMAGPGGGGPGAAAVGLGFGGGGGGGGFAVAGQGGGNGAGAGGTPGLSSGEEQILSYDGNRASAGGIGGSGLAVLGGGLLPGGGGGGGGGVVVLAADGDITAGAISANGGSGTTPSGGSILGGGGGGGGGAGGTVIVRTVNGTLTTGTIRVRAGLPGTPAGGAGSAGRVRWDAPAGNAPSSPDRAAHRGPSFKTPERMIMTPGQLFMLTGASSDELDVYVIDHDNAQHDGVHASFNSAGTATIAPTLFAGHNKLCVKLANGMKSEPAANACIDVAFLP